MRHVILDMGYSPGDMVVFTGALRDLKKAHPEIAISIRTCCPAIYEHNPHIQQEHPQRKLPRVQPHANNLAALGFDWTEPADLLFTKVAKARRINCLLYGEEYRYLDRDIADPDKALLFTSPGKLEVPEDAPEYHQVKYEDIHKSGWSGRHCSTAFHLDLEERLGVSIPQTSLLPDLHLSDEEKQGPTKVEREHGYRGPFWLINAGYKSDTPLKDWGHDNYQSLVYLLRDRVQFVQVGEMPTSGPLAHTHEPLEGALDLRGKTSLRELIVLAYHAAGVVSPVSLLMHLAGAWQKPAVVLAGGREPRRWEAYPHHRYLDTCGALPCCSYNGCWLSGRNPDPSGENKQCRRMAGGQPLCWQLITPQRAADELLLYYRGGVL